MPTDDGGATCIRGEKRLLDPAFRRSAEAVALLDRGFREFGSTGRVWDRASIVAAMSVEDFEAPRVEYLRATVLTADLVLVTYRTVRPGRSTLRSSIWRRTGDSWLLCFHQGTVISPGAGGPTPSRPGTSP